MISSPIITTLFGFPLYWYGFFYALSIVLGYILVDQTLKRIADEKSNYLRAILPQFIFWLVFWGIVGARLYHVLNEWQFYLAHPQLIPRADLGGLAIHGGLLGGALYLWQKSTKLYGFKSSRLYSFTSLRLYNFTSLQLYGFLFLTDLITPALLLGQAIGRWGNYFNQELYGSPTTLPWGIFISPQNRLAGYELYSHFHPVFFYEFVCNLLGAVLLIYISYIIWNLSSKNIHSKLEIGNSTLGTVTLLYLLFTSSGRIIAEYFRIDPTPLLFGFRLPLIVSVVILVTTASLLLVKFRHNKV